MTIGVPAPESLTAHGLTATDLVPIGSRTGGPARFHLTDADGHLLAAEVFGPARLMIGSDWPVCLLASGYERTMNAVWDWARKFTAAEQAGILGENCARFYLARHPAEG